jgi:hypothetical protein
MNEHILISGRDTLLVTIPLILMMFISAFRLDHVIATPKGSQKRRRPACGIDESGEHIVCDPDGRRSKTQRRARMEMQRSLPLQGTQPSRIARLEAEWEAGSADGRC